MRNLGDTNMNMNMNTPANSDPQLLIVDDEPDIRDMLSRHFRFIGYNVVTATDGHDALQKMEENRTDVVITDIMMLGMNGIDLLHKIREEYPMTHVIMITGYVTLANALATMRGGADRCIFKPLEDLTELDEAVELAVAQIQHWIRQLKELQHIKASTA